MIQYRFKTRRAYFEWTRDMVQALHSARITMNGVMIATLLDTIDRTLHLPEGWELYR